MTAMLALTLIVTYVGLVMFLGAFAGLSATAYEQSRLFDRIWTRFEQERAERKNAPRVAKHDALMAEVFGVKLRAYQITGLPSPTVPLEAFPVADQSMLAEIMETVDGR